nr:SKI-interacting protein, SKIP [Tanacetum cinerariifolium]
MLGGCFVVDQGLLSYHIGECVSLKMVFFQQGIAKRQEVAYRHRDSVPKVLKDDEKEHEEDDDKHKDIEETTKQTKAA